MANINAKDGTGQNIFVNASGTGTALDPFIPANVPVNPSGVYVAPVTPADLNARVPSGLIVTPEGLRVNTGLEGLATQTTLEAVRLLLAGTLQTDKTGLANTAGQADTIAAVNALLARLNQPLSINGSTVNLEGDLNLTGIDNLATEETLEAARALLQTINTNTARIATVYGSVTVGTNALRLTASPTPLRKPATIQSDPDNTGDIGIGGNNSVTLENCGHILKPGATFTFQGANFNQVWAIASAAGQVIRWAA
jgi:hypothetical protein